MAITSRPATLADIERCVSIQPLYLGNALVGRRAAVDAWKQLARDGFSASNVLESTPLPPGDRIVGFGASVFLAPAFANAELASPRQALAGTWRDEILSQQERQEARTNLASD